MSDYGEWCNDYKEAQQERRKERLPIRTDEILELETLGYEVKKFTDYQYRIQGTIDIYPIHRNWHNIKTNKRGNYTAGKLKHFIQSNIKL